MNKTEIQQYHDNHYRTDSAYRWVFDNESNFRRIESDYGIKDWEMIEANRQLFEGMDYWQKQNIFGAVDFIKWPPKSALEIGLISLDQELFVDEFIRPFINEVPYEEHQLKVLQEVETWKPIARFYFWNKLRGEKFYHPWYKKCFNYEFFDWYRLYEAKVFFAHYPLAKTLPVMDEFYYLHCMKEMEEKRPELFEEMKTFISGRVFMMIRGFERLFQ